MCVYICIPFSATLEETKLEPFYIASNIFILLDLDCRCEENIVLFPSSSSLIMRYDKTKPDEFVMNVDIVTGYTVAVSYITYSTCWNKGCSDGTDIIRVVLGLEFKCSNFF